MRPNIRFSGDGVEGTGMDELILHQSQPHKAIPLESSRVGLVKAKRGSRSSEGK